MTLYRVRSNWQVATFIKRGDSLLTHSPLQLQSIRRGVQALAAQLLDLAAVTTAAHKATKDYRQSH